MAAVESLMRTLAVWKVNSMINTTLGIFVPVSIGEREMTYTSAFAEAAFAEERLIHRTCFWTHDFVSTPRAHCKIAEFFVDEATTTRVESAIFFFQRLKEETDEIMGRREGSREENDSPDSHR